MFGIRDPGSEIRDPGSGKNSSRIPDPGGKKAPDPGSGSATLIKIYIFLNMHLIFSIHFRPVICGDVHL
jgi:hypothetical protein